MLTYQDAIDYLTDYLGGNTKDVAQREIRRAILNAYREVPEARAWHSMFVAGNVNTEAAITTGTVAYTSSSRTWTFSDSIVPTTAKYWWIRVGTNNWPLEKYGSGTTALSPSTNCPGADIASTTYTLYRDEYTLPADFRAMCTVYPENSLYARPGSQFDIRGVGKVMGNTGEPYTYTIDSDRYIPHRSSLRLHSWPSTAASVAFYYQRHARPLRYTGYAAKDRQGTASISSGGTTVTGSGTAFESGMVGSVFRFSPNGTAYPTDVTGDNPTTFESTIASYTSATSIVLHDAAPAAFSSVKYTITDPIDLPDVLFNLFFRACEKQSEITRQREGAGKGDAMQIYEAALSDAKYAEWRSMESYSIADISKRWPDRDALSGELPVIDL